MQLPQGYSLEEYGRGLEISGPMLMVLRRPDGWPVATFLPGDPTDRVERAAWRNHRERTLRVLAGGRDRL